MLVEKEVKTINLLIRLVSTLRVPNLCFEIVFLAFNEISDSSEVRELGISVNIHLDNSVSNSRLYLLLG
jgi:hypothetical protein